MECIHPQFIRFRPYQMMDTFTHFLCRFICKSDSKDILRPYAPGAKEKELDLCAAVFVSLLEGATLQYLIDPEAFDLDNYFDAARAAVKDRLALICNPSI